MNCSACKSYTYLVKFTQKYFIWFSDCRWCCIFNFSVYMFITSIKKQTDLCMSILDLVTTLVSLSSSKSLLLLRFFRIIYIDTHATCAQFYFFLYNLKTFISLSFVIALPKTSRTILRSGERRHFYYVLRLSMKLSSFSKLSLTSAVGFL